MPGLFVLGGANGVGKTTWYSIGEKNSLIPPLLPFINIDIIQKELGGYTPENTVIAEGIARARMKELISGKDDFIIESNLAKAADYEWIERMRSQGYETTLFYLSTERVSINIARVKQRVAEGGHAVPIPIIEQRYRMGHSYLKKEILLFNNAYLIDVTNTPTEIAHLQLGKIIAKKEYLPAWAKEVLFLAERLHQK